MKDETRAILGQKSKADLATFQPDGGISMSESSDRMPLPPYAREEVACNRGIYILPMALSEQQVLDLLKALNTPIQTFLQNLDRSHCLEQEKCGKEFVLSVSCKLEKVWARQDILDSSKKTPN